MFAYNAMVVKKGWVMEEEVGLWWGQGGKRHADSERRSHSQILNKVHTPTRTYGDVIPTHAAFSIKRQSI